MVNLLWKKIKHLVKMVLSPRYRREIEELKHEVTLSEEDICWLIFGCAPEDVNWSRVADKVNEGNLSVARCAEVFNKLHQREQA